MAEDITTADAMKILGVGDRQFRRLCRAHGVVPSGERRVGRVRVHLYNRAAIEYLRAQAGPKEDVRPADHGMSVPLSPDAQVEPVTRVLLGQIKRLQRRVEKLARENGRLKAELKRR